ncbi:MAG: NAD-dependent epimerase/dehydratase family protein, partial [Terrimicrobiaceae bacterium]
MRALVTGGGGFLGHAIIEQLLARGDSVKSFARGSYPHLAARGVEVVQGDIAKADAVRRAVREVDVVFHVAAKAGIWGRETDFFSANVTGTDNVIRACQQAGISRLVYTSS